MPLSGSRTEFLHSEPANINIKYGRSGGWFITARKAFGLAIIVLAALVIVGVLVYYLAPCRKDKIAQPVEASTGTPSTSVPGTNDSTNTIPSSTTPSPSDDTKTSNKKVLLRLPRTVKPHYYTIYLQPFIGEDNSNFTFKGSVSIQLYCDRMDQKCESITLHNKELDIKWDEVTLSSAAGDVSNNVSRNSTAGDVVSLNSTVVNGGLTSKVIAHSRVEGNDTITIQMDPPLETGVNYTLRIPFWGNLTDGLRGLYRSSYTDENGVKKWLAVTHLEPTSARRVFPCFDEPNFKAQFEIHVARKENLSALSNMPLNITEPITGQPGWVWDKFQPTPVMSTYLVAVLVSEFQSLTSNDTTPRFGVLARKSQVKNAEYALSVGPQILKYYTDYFGIKFPLPKLDMVALPDFQAGAMENWGLITYRETRMLVENTSSPTTKQNVASTIAHELAHMWFGNLVTMDWWTDIWLNEGFATYMSKLGMNHVEPSWQTLDQVLNKDVGSGMEIDSLHSTHPIIVTVNTTGQISEAFDPVSYSKGSCLIRMLNHSLTEPVFKAGLSDYLNTWQYGNANQDALWKSLTGATANTSGLLPDGVRVKDVMDSWTRQGGFPVVTVNRDYNTGSMKLSQQRFLFGNSTEQTLSQRWYIPVSYTNKDEMRVSDTRPRVWLGVTSDQQVTNVTKPGSDSWVLVNLQQTGFYRVNYDDTNWRLLTEYLNTAPVESIPTATRAQLIGDSMNLARAGLLNYSKALNLSLYLNRERSFVPWRTFFNAFDFLDGMLKETSAYANLVKYIEHLLTPVETLLGMTQQPTDSHTQRLLRKTVTGIMLDSEVPRYVDYALNLYRQWKNTTKGSPNPIPADIRFAVYCTAIRYGTSHEWMQMWSRFEEEDDPVDRLNKLSSLTCSRNPHLITTLLERSLQNNTNIRLQDSRSVWQSLSENPVAARVAFRFIREHWNDIFDRFQRTEFILRSVLNGVASGLSTEMDVEAFLEFKEANDEDLSQISLTMAMMIEKMQLRVLWRQRHEAAVTEWLAQHVKSLA